MDELKLDLNETSQGERIAKGRTTKAEMQLRADVVCRLLLESKTEREIYKYAAVTWGVSSISAKRYIRLATDQIREQGVRLCATELEDHIARVNELFKHACEDGNWRVAHDILKDEARLLGLYPVETKKIEFGWEQIAEANGLTEDDIIAEAEQILIAKRLGKSLYSARNQAAIKQIAPSVETESSASAPSAGADQTGSKTI